MRTKHKIHSGERGVALIFALGILALLMIMMVAFVSSMLLQYQSSSNMSRMLDADTLADAGLNRALGIMGLLIKNADPANPNIAHNFNRVVSITGTGSENRGGSAAAALEVGYEVGGSQFYIYKYDPADNKMDEPFWIYVRSNSAGTSPADTDPIIGRFAFAVVPNFHPMVNFNGTWGKPQSAGNSYAYRYGLDFREFPAWSLLGLASQPDATSPSLEELSSIKSPSGAFNYLKSLSAFDGTGIIDESVKRNLDNFFTAGQKASENYTIAEENYCRTNLIGIRYGTFNKALLENTASVDRVGAILKTTEDNGKTVVTLDARLGADSRVDDGSPTALVDANVPLNPFFAKFTAADKGTFDRVDDLKCQIAANIIDFAMPTRASVTSDVNPEDWWFDTAKIPKYTGNKRNAYINEVGIIIGVRVHVGSVGNNVTATVEGVYYRPVVETVDIYKNSEGAEDSYYAVVDAEVSGSVKITSTESATFLFSTSDGEISGSAETPNGFSIPETVGTEWSGTLTSGYRLGMGTLYKELNSDDKAQHGNDNAGFTLSLQDLSVKIKGVKLSYGGQGETVLKTGIDFAAISPDGTTTFDYDSKKSKLIYNAGDGDLTETDYFTISEDKTIYFACFLQTEDPRQNLNSGDWFKENDGRFICGDIFKVNNHWLNGEPTLGALNNKTATGLSRMLAGYKTVDNDQTIDSESVSEIAGGLLSTAYIGDDDNSSYINGYRSFSDLGAVHRGIAWQTINLKKANTSADGATACGGAYSDGDAEIADFMYLAEAGSNTYATGFDINARPIFAAVPTTPPGITGDDGRPWMKMFSDIVFSGSSSITSTGVVAIWNNIYGGTYASTIFSHRSDIADAISTAASTYSKDGSNDAEREAVFGKTVNLLEACSAFPMTTRLVVVAEIIKDVGGEGDDVALTEYNSRGEPVTKDDCRIGRFDYRNVTVGTNSEDVYFDQVVARRKMLVTVQYRPDATTLEDKLVITDIQDID